MLNALSKSGHRGFTLIELIVGIAILAILVSAAIPSFQSWMLSTQVRTAAESVQNGLQRTRSEAVGHNTNVAFTLTDPAGINSSWSIDITQPASGVAPNIDSRSSNEGSSKVTIAALPAGATSIAFNGFGSVVPNAANLTQIEFLANGSNRKFQVEISVGGSVRMCDCNQPLNANPRACTIACP